MSGPLGSGGGLDHDAAAALFLFQQVADRGLGESLAFHDAIHLGGVKRFVAHQRLGDGLDAILVGFEQFAGFIVETIDEGLGFLVDGLGGFLGIIAAAADVR